MELAAALSHQRRQAGGGGGFPALTPDELSQIDLDDKSSLEIMVKVVCIVVISLVGATVLLRLVVRRKRTGRFFLDDCFIILAAVFTLVVCSVSIVATRYGLGQHVWNLNLVTVMDDLSRCVQLMFVGNVFYALAIAFTKLSIIASYMHIFSPTGTMRYILYATGAVTVGLLVASIPATVFQCHPVSAAWDFSLPHDGCYTFVNFLYAATAINVVTDLILCTVPIPYFWRLQLPAKERVLVSMLFFVGGFACVASIIRIAYLHLLNNQVDVTYNLVSSLLWTIAECTIGIVCVSIPALRPAFAKIMPALFGSQWTVQQSEGRPRTVSKTSTAHTHHVVDSSTDEFELVSSSRRSWAMLSDPEAQMDPVWERDRKNMTR